MKISYNHIFLTFWLLALFCGIALGDFKDYSNTGVEYKLLKNIRFDALSVSFVEKRKVFVLGELAEASVFKIKTREDADAVDGPADQYNNVHTDVDMVYEFIVGPDGGHRIYDGLIDQIYAISLNAPDKGKEFRELGLFPTADSYLIYKGPAAIPELIWIDDKFVQVNFKYFDSKIRRRDRAENTETFWRDKIRFYSDEKKLRIESVKEGFRDWFLRLYREGKFKKP
jgi:hypothetical protein